MKIILASQSPRRQALLAQFDLPFEAIPSTIVETISENESPESIVMGLALEKALDVAHKNPEALIIASDTIVYNGAVLGKPRDQEEAFKVLKDLNGKTHKVYTGLALVYLPNQKKVIDYTETSVVFHQLSDEALLEYVKTNDPLDKAGSYGIQGVGSLLVKEIRGDYYSVMGMPLSRLNLLLKEHFDMNLKF